VGQETLTHVACGDPNTRIDTVGSLRAGKIGGGSGMLKQKYFLLLGIPLSLHYLCIFNLDITVL
jgi:hypothetical protein